MKKPKKILLIVAHPDDETLGAGGTIKKHHNNGDSINCIFLTNGISARTDSTLLEKDKLRNDTIKATKLLGINNLHFLDFPDNELDKISLLQVTKNIEKYIDRYKPDIIYTHHHGDLNIDHRICNKAVMTACRPCNINCPNKIYAFETLSSTEWQTSINKQFHPNVFINIIDTINTKIKALEKYTTETRNIPHPRTGEGIITLSKYRGLQSKLLFAEAFTLIKEIEK